MSMDHNIYLGHYATIKGSTRRDVSLFAQRRAARCIYSWVDTEYEVLVIGSSIDLRDVAREDGSEVRVDISKLTVTAELRDEIIEHFGRENVSFNFGLVHEVA